jgi:alpha-beta hydrolase superfamily lysophospholipase
MTQPASYLTAGLQGEPVILVHGMAASYHDWDYLMPTLTSRGFGSFALDILRHGDSCKPHRSEQYTGENLYSYPFYGQD